MALTPLHNTRVALAAKGAWRVAAAGAVLFCAALPGHAMTEIEAASLNAQLAMRTCLQNYQAPDALVAAMQSAGYAYRRDDFGGGEVIHVFTTPDENVFAHVIVNGPNVECRIGSSLWGTEAAVPFAKAVFAKIAPQVATQDGSPEGVNILPGTPAAQNDACSGFHALIPRTMLWVQVERQGNDGTCVSDGTSVIRMRF